MLQEPLSPDDILYEACHISCPEERRRYLDQVCHGDQGLRKEIEAKAAIAPFVDEILPESALNAPLWLNQDDAPPREHLTGMVMGGYRIVRSLGEGGFGRVFEARPVSGIGARVAIKIIKPGMDTDEVLARFRREQALLSQLDHPNIARPFAQGRSPQGRPYMVMELISGQTITSYCDQRRFSIRKRIELFLSVCDAIEHAHSKSIIHRDLKPSNILVTEVDSHPVVKVIDFGVAKAMGCEGATATMHSRPSQLIGTPQYMSPEQAVQGEVIGEHSDQYSLAAVLYELITGRSHLGLSESQCKDRAHCLTQLTRGDALWPSNLLGTLTSPQLLEIADSRGTDPSGLFLAIDRDLESILFKALQRDPHQRYANVVQLSDNLRSHLTGSPVVGTTPTFFYVVRKLARDYQRLMLVASLFVAMLLATTVFSMWMAMQAREAQALALASERKAKAALLAEHQAREDESRQRQLVIDAVQQQLAAERLAHEAEKINTALGKELMSSAATGPKRRDELTFREALNHAAATVVPRYANEPLVQAALLEAIARAQQSLTANSDAIIHLRRALDLRRSFQSLEHPDTIKTESQLVQVYFNMAQYHDAEPLVNHVREYLQKTVGPDNRDAIEADYLWITCLSAAANSAEARQVAESTLSRARALLPAEEVLILRLEQQMAAIYQQASQRDKAERLLSESLVRHQEILGTKHPLTLSCETQLAGIYNWRRQYAEALPRYEQILAAQKEVLGADHFDVLVTELHLASVYSHLGRLEEAQALFLETLEKQKDVLGATHPLTLKTQANLADTYVTLGKHSSAEALYETILAQMESVLGPDHEHTVVTRRKLGLLKYDLGKLAEAERLLRLTLEFSRRCEGPEHRHALGLECDLAVSLRDQQKFEEAEALFTKALAVQRRTLGDRHAETLKTLQEYAVQHLKVGKYTEAESLLQEVLEGRRATLGAEHEDTLEVEAMLRALASQPTPHDVTPASSRVDDIETLP